MPSIITHDFFGREVYERLGATIGETREELEAFLLGNQGPDPLFYARTLPSLSALKRYGSEMHCSKTDELLATLRDSLYVLTPEERPIGRAYALGFLCHYLLDSTEHPLVYAQEFAICDAGIEGLTRDDGSEVHAVIETTFDEVVLYRRRGETIVTFKPYKEILKASDEVLQIIGKMHSYIAVMVFGTAMDISVFEKCVKSFRLVQGIFYSPRGYRRRNLARIEEVGRHYSFVRSMMHRPKAAETCEFDNHDHIIWIDPFTDEPRNESFFDLFDRAQSRAEQTFALFDAEDFDAEAAHQITGGLNFSGNTRYGCQQA